MLESEYLVLLEKIRKLIKRGKEAEALSKLDELFKIKPVRLKWFVVRAEVLAALGRWEEGASLLRERYWPTYEDDEAYAYFEWHRRWCREKKDKVREAAYHYVQELILHREDRSSSQLVCDMDEEVFKCEQDYLEEPDNKTKCMALVNAYFVINRSLEFLVLRTRCIHRWGVDIEKQLPHEALFNHSTINRDFFMECLKEKNVYVVAAKNENDVQSVYTIGITLLEFGHKVFFMLPPVSYNISNAVSIEDTVQISMENIEYMNGLQVIRPIEITSKDSIKDNQAELLNHIAKQTERDFILLLSPVTLWEHICTNPMLKKRSGRLTDIGSEIFNKSFQFGYIGNYVSYTEQIYHINILSEISKESKCAISIIVPARNSAETLRYTLDTCLNQRFSDYEIIVSDNSSQGSTAVHDLVKEMDDSKIKYYKTPRNLELSRSFEFAFAKANGDFLFSIGADDAVLPWGLETMDLMLKKYPQDDLFSWDRGFYIWPDFINARQNGQFVISGNYRKGIYSDVYISAKDMLDQVMQNGDLMYRMPLLYINSGCRRRYLKNMLKKTGRLWDGISQDIYMGIVNLATNEKWMCIQYPLTIAGMSSKSIGANGIKSSSKLEDLKRHLTQPTSFYSFGAHNPIPQELPFVMCEGSDRAALYGSIFRAISYGILSEEFLEKVNYEKIYEQIARQLPPDSLNYDRTLNLLRYSAKQLGSDFAERFEVDFYQNMIAPRFQHEEPAGCNLYRKGFNVQGGLVLDSRKFNVKNVKEAANLFVNIINL